MHFIYINSRCTVIRTCLFCIGFIQLKVKKSFAFEKVYECPSYNQNFMNVLHTIKHKPCQSTSSFYLSKIIVNLKRHLPVHHKIITIQKLPFNCFHEYPLRDTLANSEDPVEMPHDVAFHQDLNYFLIQKQASRKKSNIIEI